MAPREGIVLGAQLGTCREFWELPKLQVKLEPVGQTLELPVFLWALSCYEPIRSGIERV